MAAVSRSWATNLSSSGKRVNLLVARVFSPVGCQSSGGFQRIPEAATSGGCQTNRHRSIAGQNQPRTYPVIGDKHLNSQTQRTVNY